MRLMILVSLLVVVVTGGAGLMLRHTAVGSGRDSEPELSAATERVGGSPRGISHQAGARQRSTLVSEATAGLSTTPSSEPATASAVARRTASRAEDTRRSLDLRLESESPDPSWAEPAKSALIRDVYAAGVEQTSVVEARCGSTLCRITLQHQRKLEVNSVPNALGTMDAFAGGAYFHRETTTNRTVVYAARPGRQLFGTGSGLGPEAVPGIVRE